MDIKELIAQLMDKQKGQGAEMRVLLGTAAGTIENLLGQVDALKAELRDERHRHDRYVDFELAEAEELRKLKEQLRWIPATERLPGIGGNYFVVVKYKYDFEKEYSYDIDFAEFTFSDGYIDNCWNTYNDWNEGQQYLHITHWMPLPEPPKGE